jgi:hypothetical protein
MKASTLHMHLRHVITEELFIRAREEDLPLILIKVRKMGFGIDNVTAAHRERDIDAEEQPLEFIIRAQKRETVSDGYGGRYVGEFTADNEDGELYIK